MKREYEKLEFFMEAKTGGGLGSGKKMKDFLSSSALS
jgi:hypothetical protein